MTQWVISLKLWRRNDFHHQLRIFFQVFNSPLPLILLRNPVAKPLLRLIALSLLVYLPPGVALGSVLCGALYALYLGSDHSLVNHLSGQIKTVFEIDALYFIQVILIVILPLLDHLSWQTVRVVWVHRLMVLLRVGPCALNHELFTVLSQSW